MKVEPYSDQPPIEDHPLFEAVKALRESEPGQRLRISELPRGYYGRDPDVLAVELSELCGFDVAAEVGDSERTPESYIVERWTP